MSIPIEKLEEYWWYRLIKGIYYLCWTMWFFSFSMIFILGYHDIMLETIFIGIAFVLWILKQFFFYVVSGDIKI